MNTTSFMHTERLVVSSGLQRSWKIMTVIATLILVATSAFAPARTWANGLLVAYYLVTLGLGGAVFIALANATGAGWHVAIRRIPEALTSVLPIAGLALLGLVLAQLPRYIWHHHGAKDVGTFWFKELWLSPIFFGIRSVLYLTVWILFARRFVRVSRRQDELATGKPTRINATSSVVFLFTFGITFSLAAIDWIMALEPMWFSTIWGVYQFSGMLMATLAVLIIAGIILRRIGTMRGTFRDEHLHDLSKLLLGFSCFWMYIWFCQYMLIWYSNIPEETVYFTKRLQGAWGPMILASLVLNWVIPFFMLLPRSNKRNETIMLRVAVIVLIGRWVDLSVMIFPSVVGDAPPLGIPEVAGVATGCGIAVWCFARSFATAPPVPRYDPFLLESLHYHS